MKYTPIYTAADVRRGDVVTPDPNEWSCYADRHYVVESVQTDDVEPRESTRCQLMLKLIGHSASFFADRFLRVAHSAVDYED